VGRVRALYVVVPLLFVGLCIGWTWDHCHLVSSNNAIRLQLIEETHQARFAGVHSDLWHNDYLQAQSLLEDLQKKERSEASDLEQSKDGSDQKIEFLTHQSQDNSDSFKDAMKALDITKQTLEREKSNSTKWFNIAVENRRELNELWSYTRSLYANDAAIQQAMGQQLYEEMNKPAPSYTAVFNGAGYTVMPDKN
jgi:hypothetical protein